MASALTPGGSDSRSAALPVTTSACPFSANTLPSAASASACETLTLPSALSSRCPAIACTEGARPSSPAAVSRTLNTCPPVEKPGSAASACACAALSEASALSCVAPAIERSPDRESRAGAVSTIVSALPAGRTCSPSRKVRNCAALTLPGALNTKALAWPSSWPGMASKAAGVSDTVRPCPFNETASPPVSAENCAAETVASALNA